MFKMWGKIVQSRKILRDEVISLEIDDTRTHKILSALDHICNAFDLSRPIWLDRNVSEFKRYGRTRFTQDCFIESIDFDYLEISILEETD